MACPVLRVPLLLAAVLLAPLPGYAQTTLADPTRPPAALASPEADAGGGGAPVLQSVKIPKKGKPVAFISGQQVRLGESYGEARLTRLTEREAVLESAAGTLHLMLTPGIEKTVTKTKSPARAQEGAK